MSEKHNIDTLIEGLQEVRKDAQLEEILQSALSAPLPTKQRLQQIESALETFKSLGLFGGGDQRDIHMLKSLGRAYEQLSHLDKAFETYNTALELSERYTDFPARAELLGWKGRVLSKWSRWEEAHAALEESTTVYRQLDDVKGQAYVSRTIGVLYSRQSDFERAHTAYEQALEFAEKAGSRRKVAAANNNLAILATIRGDKDAAISRYEASIAAYEEVDDHRGIAGAYHNLGMTQADIKDFTSAMDSYEKGFEVARKVDHLVCMANIHLSMAELMLEMGNSMMVPFCCTRALDIYKKTGNQSGEADTYRLLGNTFTLRRDWESAQQLFADSLALNIKCGNRLGAAQVERDTGKMMIARGHREDAMAALESAHDAFKELGAEADEAEVAELLMTLG